MPSYRRMGILPPKRHIQFENAGDSYLNEGLYYEHVVTTQGFDKAYSILYHNKPPTRILKSEPAGRIQLEKYEEQELRHHHIRTQDLPRTGDPITGRVPMMFNEDLTAWRCKPETQQTELYRNGAADEVIFIQQGSGYVDSVYGRLPYKRGDYVVMPRTATYQMVSDDISIEDHLILETFSPVQIPERYQNEVGQMYLGVPYYERDFHSPTELITRDEEGEFTILIKDLNRMTRVTVPHHPFNLVGWDGFLYPYTF